MDPLIAPEVVSRRVRAAVEYAGISEDEAVKRTKISRSKWRRLVSKSDPRGFLKREELESVAAGLDVPEDFLLYGFGDSVPGTEEKETLRQQLARHERLLRELIAQTLPSAGGQKAPMLHPGGAPPADTADTAPQEPNQQQQDGQ